MPKTAGTVLLIPLGMRQAKKTLHIADEADLAGLAAIVNGTAAVKDDFSGKNGLCIDDIQLIYDLYTNYADYCGDKNFDIADIAARFRADYNGDGVVDVQDVQAVMNLFLNS